MRVPRDSWLMSTELFVPLVAVDVVDSLDEAIALANDTPLGLTAGFFSGTQPRWTGSWSGSRPGWST